MRALKTIASSLGLIDSQQTLVGIADIRSIDHVRGDADAAVTLVEYSDFNCLMCAAMQPNFERLVREEKVRVVSRHLYSQGATDSFERALAAECVARFAGEEAYFLFAQYLYDSQHGQGAVSPPPLSEKAVSLGVDVYDFQSCVQDDRLVRAKVVGDSEEGWRLGARGTPYILVMYQGEPVGISYANEYDRFLDRVRLLVVRSRS